VSARRAVDKAGTAPYTGLSSPERRMVRRRPSIGLFGFLGRSPELREVDRTLRAVDLHPRLVPEAIKLTMVSLLQDHAVGPEPAPQAYRAAAEIVAYCMIGPAGFANANGEDLTLAVERRIEGALESGESLDAKLVLLTLHARTIQPDVVAQFGLETESS
jgi:hypothetical protein